MLIFVHVNSTSVEEMERDVAAYQRWVSSRFYGSQRHTIDVKYIKLMDELAMLVGCKRPLCARATWTYCTIVM